MEIKKKISKNIKKFGWDLIHVLENEKSSRYSYTIGLNLTYNHPDISISGLSQEVSTQILSDIVEKISSGNNFVEDRHYDEILEGYNCIFKNIKPENYELNFGRAMEFYDKKQLKIMQCFYPDKNKLFPWDLAYNLTIQEIL